MIGRRLQRVLLPYATFGPYHIARARVAVPTFAAEGMELVPVELFPSSSVYRWESSDASIDIVRLRLARANKDDLSVAAIPELLKKISSLRPDAVLINGWGLRHSMALHAWCRTHGVARVLVSDSQAKDSPRRPLAESLKSWIVRGCGSAFVAGKPQRRYLEHLGFDKNRIVEGCDVVDNAHFAAAAHERRWDRSLLTVARFEPAKNLLRACAAFLRFSSDRMPERWKWTIVGYGSLENAVREFAERSAGAIRVMGFADYATLPKVYAGASAYWQPSVSEPWGLAVNEAMASGLPVLVSSQCGCHEDLVNKSNGWIFDPFSDDATHDALVRAASDHCRWPQMGQASAERIRAWDLDRFARAAICAARSAIEGVPIVSSTQEPGTVATDRLE